MHAEENPVGYVTNGVHVTDLPRARMGRGVRPLPRRRLDAPARAIRASGRRSATSPTTSSGACARTSRRACCTCCAIASRASTCATTAASRTSSACCATPIRRSPNVLTIGFGAALRHLQARDAAVQRSRQLARASSRDQDRPVVFLFAGKAHPGRRAGPGADPHARAHVAARRSSRGACCSSRATTCTSRGAWSRASTCGSTTRCIRWRPPAPRA